MYYFHSVSHHIPSPLFLCPYSFFWHSLFFLLCSRSPSPLFSHLPSVPPSPSLFFCAGTETAVIGLRASSTRQGCKGCTTGEQQTAEGSLLGGNGGEIGTWRYWREHCAVSHSVVIGSVVCVTLWPPEWMKQLNRRRFHLKNEWIHPLWKFLSCTHDYHVK